MRGKRAKLLRKQAIADAHVNISEKEYLQTGFRWKIGSPMHLYRRLKKEHRRG